MLFLRVDAADEVIKSKSNDKRTGKPLKNPNKNPHHRLYYCTFQNNKAAQKMCGYFFCPLPDNKLGIALGGVFRSKIEFV